MLLSAYPVTGYWLFSINIYIYIYIYIQRYDYKESSSLIYTK